MARFRCRACGDKGNLIYDAAAHRCPTCGAADVQFAVGIEEIDDDHSLIAAMTKLAEMDDHANED